jgi:hypothetical protein
MFAPFCALLILLLFHSILGSEYPWILTSRNLIYLFSSCTIYSRSPLYSGSMSSRFFKHYWWVHPSHALICYNWTHLLIDSVGATLTASGATTIHLLPGQYSASSSPQVLHDTLTSSSASLLSSPGFTNSTTVSLPLNLALQAGLATFSGTLYSGQSSFTALPNKLLGSTSTPLAAQSLTLSSAVWAAINSSSNPRVIVWEAVPDVSQLPANNRGSLSLIDIQSSTCNPSCATSGVCTTSGTCKCASGFTGTSCESCASGFFGPKCQPCPTNCETCDDGITGSGTCLQPLIANNPANCKCLNGVCGSNGQCTCNAGFTTASNGTACAACLPGFFLTSSGDCSSTNLAHLSCFLRYWPST